MISSELRIFNKHSSPQNQLGLGIKGGICKYNINARASLTVKYLWEQNQSILPERKKHLQNIAALLLKESLKRCLGVSEGTEDSLAKEMHFLQRNCEKVLNRFYRQQQRCTENKSCLMDFNGFLEYP